MNIFMREYRHKKTCPVCVVQCTVCEDDYLQLPQGVITLLLPRCLLRTERYQLVNALCHRPETHKAATQPLKFPHVSSACTHRLASLTRVFSSPTQAWHCWLLAAFG